MTCCFLLILNLVWFVVIAYFGLVLLSLFRLLLCIFDFFFFGYVITYVLCVIYHLYAFFLFLYFSHSVSVCCGQWMPRTGRPDRSPDAAGHSPVRRPIARRCRAVAGHQRRRACSAAADHHRAPRYRSCRRPIVASAGSFVPASRPASTHHLAAPEDAPGATPRGRVVGSVLTAQSQLPPRQGHSGTSPPARPGCPHLLGSPLKQRPRRPPAGGQARPAGGGPRCLQAASVEPAPADAVSNR